MPGCLHATSGIAALLLHSGAIPHCHSPHTPAPSGATTPNTPCDLFSTCRTWYKHRDNHFLPAYAQGMAMSLAQVPISLIEASVFSLIMYFMVDLYRTPVHFFTFWMVTISNGLVSSALFRLQGCLAPSMVRRVQRCRGLYIHHLHDRPGPTATAVPCIAVCSHSSTLRNMPKLPWNKLLLH